MKTITIIMIVLILAAVISLGFVILKYTVFKPVTEEKPIESEQNETETTEESEPPPAEEETDTEPEEDKVAVIEIYLDGDRQNGTFLGEAVYGMTSKEAFTIYGEDFSETGFIFTGDDTDYTFEPGSTHYIYVYALIPEYGWNYTREKVVIPGEAEVDNKIRFSIDDPQNNEEISADDRSDIRVSGWSLDTGRNDSTGIEDVEIYLNGPRGYGKFLGEADYGIERTDVATAFGNPDYIYSGYSLFFDGSDLEPGTRNTIYVYSFSSSVNYNLGMRDFVI